MLGERVEERNHAACCSCCEKRAVCHCCGSPVKRAPFATKGEPRCVSGACMVCCANHHKHPRG